MKRQSILAGVLSVGFLFLILGIWYLATLPKAGVASGGDAEYAKLMGKAFDPDKAEAYAQSFAIKRDARPA